jgi:hypothetical protein
MEMFGVLLQEIRSGAISRMLTYRPRIASPMAPAGAAADGSAGASAPPVPGDEPPTPGAVLTPAVDSSAQSKKKRKRH